MPIVQKLQFLKWPHEASAKSESITIGHYVKIANFTAELRLIYGCVGVRVHSLMQNLTDDAYRDTKMCNSMSPLVRTHYRSRVLPGTKDLTTKQKINSTLCITPMFVVANKKHI